MSQPPDPHKYLVVREYRAKALELTVAPDLFPLCQLLWEHHHARQALVHIQLLLTDPGHGMALNDRHRTLYNLIALGASLASAARSMNITEDAARSISRKLFERFDRHGVDDLRLHWLSRLNRAAESVRFQA